MDESAPAPATDDADRASASPFHRFPWVQLAFCAACLGMAAWTWMRYSYAWDTAPDNFSSDCDGYFLRMTAAVEQWKSVRFPPATPTMFLVDDPLHEWPEPVGKMLWEVREAPESDVFIPFIYVVAPSTQVNATNVFLGRARDASINDGVGWYRNGTVLDTTASRFRPASAAGFVVGAMGVFIFGLYLRRWLRERGEAAAPGERDAPGPAGASGPAGNSSRDTQA